MWGRVALLLAIWYDIGTMGPRYLFTELLRRVRRRRARRNGKQWVGLRELAEITGVSYHALRQAAWQDRFPGFRKSGGIWLGTKAAVDRALERGHLRRMGRE